LRVHDHRLRSAQEQSANAGGSTALSFAIGHNKLEAVKLLLAHGANSDIVINDGMTLLALGALRGHLEVVEELLRTRSPTLLNARTHDGSTALYIAVDRNFPHVVDALLAAGADPNITNGRGSTSLIQARDTEVARRLLDSGADANASLPTGDTVLIVAALSDSSDTSLLALLLERAADADASRSDGCNALMLAARKDRLDLLTLLLAANPPVEVNQQNRKGIQHSILLLKKITGQQQIFCLMLVRAPEYQIFTVYFL
jgi:ankyrin repeat protein